MSETLFSTVQLIRHERTTSHGSPVRQVNAWLTTLVWCTKCGSKLWHQFGNKRTQARYYRCSGVSRRECTAPRARAVTIEGEMEQILKLLVVPDHLVLQIIAEAQQLHAQCAPPDAVRDTAQETYLHQLKQAYNAGILTRSEYERKVKEAQQKKGQTPGGVAFDAQEALRLLADIPRLIEKATAQERLALVKSLFDRIWVEDRRIAKLTLRADVGPVIAALVRVLHGVPDGLQAFSLQPRIYLADATGRPLAA